MQDFEKLGVFYLGKKFNIESNQVQDELVLLKSKDLTTHAVIIGMTGSGKTGLGIGLIEEAAIDNIPVIAIDPKGDLTNLALAFPQLRKDDFKPWINLQEAANKGMTADDYAQAQADLWRKGLTDWGQDERRIETFSQAAKVRIFTPGSFSGRSVSILKSFNAPSSQVIQDKDAFRERIMITVNGLLSLIGIEADPFSSREYILISNIFERAWSANEDLGLPELIALIQKPPFDKVGIMDVENFYPSKDRFSLAMSLNNLIASPGFEAWVQGDPLDVNAFLYDENGKPRTSVFTIAHLSERERMFFVTMLLNEILSWVRSQPGTGSLRALLYMDELFGYLPPTANPPSKTPLLTLLKQARAYGLGLVLSTQNPVDLDYKALSNAGTWFIGRLQTERDKERVLAGLEGATLAGKFDKARMERILAGLGQRVFYLHSVHEDEPVIFTTRWVLSYLAGPLGREQIASLASVSQSKETNQPQKNQFAEEDVVKKTSQTLRNTAPSLSPAIKQVYLMQTSKVSNHLVYTPFIIGIADVLYNSAKYGITATKSYALLAPIHDGPIPIDWSEATLLDINVRDLDSEPLDGIAFSDYPSAVAEARNYDQWKKLLTQHLRIARSLKLYLNPALKCVSNVGEDARDFSIRLQHQAHELRDEELEGIKKKYASRFETLNSKLMRAKQTVEKQNAMASQKKMEAAVSAGSALLGALLGRKTISPTSISRMSTAVKSTSRAMKSGQGIENAMETLQSIENQQANLQLEMDRELERVSAQYDAATDKLEEIEIRAASENITVHLVGLAWICQD